MIPYLALQTLSLGPITIQVWGTFVALGILIGTYTSAKFAKKNGIEKEIIYECAFWIIVSAMVFSRIFHVLFYEPAYYWQYPLEALLFWHGGFSVMGGFLGAIMAFAFLMKKKRLAWLTYVDALLYGLPLGLGCGRIGCFLIHDHPGTATDFFLGVNYPDGTVRHDHGLYLSINGFVMAIFFYFLAKKTRHQGFFAQVFLLWYGSVRFFLDFYRAIDTKYGGLTPAQYLCLVMVLGGLGWYAQSKRKLSL